MKAFGRTGLGLVALAALVPGLAVLVSPAIGDEAAAAKDAAAEPAKVERVGTETCLECHEGFAAGWKSARHNKYLSSTTLPADQQGCESCHGPGGHHVEDPSPATIVSPGRLSGRPATQMCFQCHATDIKEAQWAATPHAKAGMNCAGCHEVHNEPAGPSNLKADKTKLCLGCHAEQGAEFKLNSHHPVLEGRMDCSDCHDPHEQGANERRLLKSGDDMCLRCHLDKRGPFVFEHETDIHDGQARCLTCHKAHGSPNAKLQTYFGRGNCLQCHTDIAADGDHAGRTGNCSSAGCHNRIHGSNRSRVFIN